MATERQRRKPGPKPRPMTVIETFEPTPDWEERFNEGLAIWGRLIARYTLAKRAERERAEQEQAS